VAAHSAVLRLSHVPAASRGARDRRAAPAGIRACLPTRPRPHFHFSESAGISTKDKCAAVIPATFVRARPSVGDGEAFGALKLAQTGARGLKGETNVMLREQPRPAARVSRGKQTVGKKAAGAAARDSVLLQALRACAGALPASTAYRRSWCFHDSTLETIAALQRERSKRCAACPGGREETRALRGGLRKSCGRIPSEGSHFVGQESGHAGLLVVPLSVFRAMLT